MFSSDCSLSNRDRSILHLDLDSEYKNGTVTCLRLCSSMQDGCKMVHHMAEYPACMSDGSDVDE